MNISLDYDDTFTADPDLWRRFSAQARGRGHKVYVVTLRADAGCDEVRRECGPFVDGIIPCNYRPKREAVRAAGVRIDVWVDDMPETIASGDAGVVLV